MTDKKTKYGFWLTPEISEEINTHLTGNNCASRSEFVEKAVLFYFGYLNTQNASAFLPEALHTMMEGTLDAFGDRMGSLLYKLAVENNLQNHILAADTDMDVPTYQRMRGRSVREVQSTNGKITFQDALNFQKTV